MAAVLFGELLGRYVRLTPHDVCEILEEQSHTGHRFGQIALRWGLCRPHHVWRAWSAQLTDRAERVDLDRVGIDTQALRHLAPSIARSFAVVPVRMLADQIVVATTAGDLARVASQLPSLLKRDIRLVVAEPRQIDQAIERYYQHQN